MSELPNGWVDVTVGELGEYINGRGFKKTEWSTSGRPIIRIQNLTGSGSSFNYFDGPLEERYIVSPGSLLVSWAATLGVYRWTGPEGALNQHIFRVRSFIDEGFHRYLLQDAVDLMQGNTHGSGMVHITRGRFDETPVSLPPIAEQDRIVTAIEEAFSKLDAGEAGLRTVRQLLKRMREAVLAAASCRPPRPPRPHRHPRHRTPRRSRCPAAREPRPWNAPGVMGMGVARRRVGDRRRHPETAQEGPADERTSIPPGCERGEGFSRPL